MNYILTTSNLTKTYGSVHAAENIDIHIRKGEIYGLIGRNGAGKTTIMRIITGALAVVLAFSLTMTSISVMKELRVKVEETANTVVADEEAAEKYAKSAGMFVKCFDNPYLGLGGMIYKATSVSEADLQELTDLLNYLNHVEVKGADPTDAQTSSETAEAGR